MLMRKLWFVAILVSGVSFAAPASALTNDGQRPDFRSPAQVERDREEALLGNRRVELEDEGQIRRLTDYPGNALFCDKRNGHGKARYQQTRQTRRSARSSIAD